jgi:hypothetical protein
MVLNTIFKDIPGKESSNLFDYPEDQFLLDALNSKIKIDVETSKTDNIKVTDISFENKSHENPYNLSNIFNKPSVKFNNYMCRSQNWVGHIIEITESEFTAKLIDKLDPTTYEIAQFEIDEVSQGDLGLLKMGALFYWSVGYANQNGQVSKQSLIRFKRSIDFTVQEFDSLIDKANEINASLKWD